MIPNNIIDKYLNNGCSLTPELLIAIANNEIRDSIYKIIPNNPQKEFRALLLAMFKEEMRYRDEMWRGKIDDAEDLYENIYLCAFLIQRIANVEDILILWKAKHLNMDVGSILDAYYMVGAGVQVTKDYLKNLDSDEATEILNYISDWDLSPEDIIDWYYGQIEYFDRQV